LVALHLVDDGTAIEPGKPALSPASTIRYDLTSRAAERVPRDSNTEIS